MGGRERERGVKDIGYIEGKIYGEGGCERWDDGGRGRGKERETCSDRAKDISCEYTVVYDKPKAKPEKFV